MHVYTKLISLFSTHSVGQVPGVMSAQRNVGSEREKIISFLKRMMELNAEMSETRPVKENNKN